MAASSSSSSDIEVLEMATEGDSETSAFFSADGDAAALSWPGAEKITSTLTGTRKELRALCSKFDVPDVYTPYYARERPACTAAAEEDNAISVHVDAFDAGLRLPLHQFYVDVLLHYGLAPSQLVPNAWRYMAAFVLLCADAGVEPLLPVFRHVFTVSSHKGESRGWHHFRTYSPKAQPSVFSTGISTYPPWKTRFFFLRSPPTTPWPCPVKWGKLRKAAIPTLTTAEKTALQKLLDTATAIAGKEGISVVPFLSERTLPVGCHAPLPLQLAAVKQEATAIAGTTIELWRKRKSPESATPPPQQSQSGVGTSTPLGSAHAGPSNVSVGDRSASTRSLKDRVVGALEQAKMAMAELDENEQELQASKDDEIAQLKLELQVTRDGPARFSEELRLAKEALEKANAARSAEVGRLLTELQQAKAEVRSVKIDCQRKLISLELDQSKYIKGLRDMRQLAIDIYPQVVKSSELKHPLLYIRRR